MSKKPSKKKEIFLLKNVNPYETEVKYGLQQTAPIQEKTSISFLETTTVESSTHFSFLDESKKFVIAMQDSLTRKQISIQTCFWCRHPFSTIPIGCPLRYVPSLIVKSCHSETFAEDTKETYVVEQEISPLVGTNISNLEIYPKDYYETEGAFCSFNCCMAYIDENATKSVYRNSKSLLGMMYLQVFGVPKKIQASPDWRLLQDYGGHLTIDEFRMNGNYVYLPTNYMISELPRVSPLGKIYEQLYIF